MSYVFEKIPSIILPTEANNPVIEELLSNYTYGGKWNVSFEGDGNCIIIGNGTEADYGNDEYIINVTDAGIYVGGRDFSGAMRGFVTLLEKIRYCETDNFFYVENCCLTESPRLEFRAVHLCVFPETTLELLRKCVRSCAIVKYSHIIMEFWGMLKFDCMKELSWQSAYTKAQIKEIVAEANALGVEIIPMFNHLGHAPSSRGISGKHVVLDQNPRYEYMFESYGWVWNLKRKDVRELLGKIRDELIELCGKGSYFHLGCDEAYVFGHYEDKAQELTEYLNELSEELQSKGRRAIIWHDMMLDSEEFAGYEANSNGKVSEILLNNINKDILIADWQYSVHREIWKTTQKLKEYGFDLVCCPWDNKCNIDEAIQTVASNNLCGIIHTTWHTLYKGFKDMVYAGVVAYGTDEENIGDLHKFYCASVARKVMPSYGDYANSGWNDVQVGAQLG